jgi:two-component system response regulator YesN
MDKPFNILIVDDEQLERMLIESIIKEKYGDQFYLYLAKNGKEAIECCKEHLIDIAIMDISMPILGGLEAIIEIKKVSPHTDFFMLTAYSEFEYAQKALNYGGTGYLLKPIEPDKLFEMIDSILEKRKKAEHLRIKTEKLENTISQITPLMKNIFYQKLLFNQFIRYSEIEEFREMSGVTFIPDQVAVAELSQNQIKQLNRLFINKQNFIIYEEKLIMFGNERNKMTNLFLFFEKYTGPLKIGVGKKYNSALNLHQSYIEALQAKAYMSLISNEKVVLFEDIQKQLKNTVHLGIKEVKHLLKQIKKADKAEVENGLSIIKLWINQPIGNVKVGAMELLYLLTELMYDLDFEEKLIMEWREQYYLIITSAKSHEPILQQIEELITNIVEVINTRPKNFQDGMIEDCKTYIQENYMNNIDMTDLTNKLHVNPSYLSKLFKKKVGINFVDYLNNLRINRAKRLLSNTSYSIDEISLQVGFNTHKYFSYVFKKYTNTSPSEFRLESNKKGEPNEYYFTSHD